MARGEFSGGIQLSQVHFNDFSSGSLGLQLADNVNMAFQGTTYEDALTLFSEQESGSSSLEWYGRRIITDADGDVTGGTVSAFATYFRPTGGTWMVESFLVGFNLRATEMFAAFQTTSTTDDLVLIRKMLVGNDSIKLSVNDDEFYGWTGNDSLRGFGGDDTLKGDAGNDTLIGDAGNDRLLGGSDGDVLSGGAGNDVMNGGYGVDTLTGGAGNDTLSGNDTGGGDAGVDFFLFAAGAGRDRIMDFDNGADIIEISSGAESFADLTIVQVGTAVRISFANVQILVLNETVDHFSASDFQFT